MRRQIVAIAMIAMPISWAARAQEAAPPGLDAASSEAAAAVPMQEATVEGAASRDVAATSTTGARAAEQAGAHGDPLVAAQTLAGVARPPLGSGQLSVWGADPSQTRLLIDGIEVPALFHFGGYRSVLPAEITGPIVLHPAAFGAEYGRALGGVLEAATVLPALDSPRFLAAVDPLDAHASVAAPLGDARFYAGARYSLLDRIAGPFLSEDARALLPLPQDWDAQLLAEIPLRAGESLTLILLTSSDSSQRTLDPQDTSVARGDSSQLRWARLGARYHRALDGGAETNVLLWAGDELQAQRTFFGDESSDQIRWAQSGGLRASWRTPLSEQADFTLGADALATRTSLRRSGSLTSPAREGDVTVFGEPLGDDVSFDRWSVLQTDAAFYGESHLELGRLSLTLGLRASGVSTDVSRATPRIGATPSVGLSQLEWFAEPRAAAELRLLEPLRLFAAAGFHHQAADPQDLSAVFGTPSLGSSRALHALAGAALRPRPFLELQASGFYRLLDDLAVRSSLASPLPAQALAQQGSGQVVGMQLIARAHAGPLTCALTGVYSHSERTDVPGAPARLFDLDQPWLVTASAEWHLARETLLSARFRFASGAPRTPVVGAYLDSKSGLLEPIFGAQNSSRLPPFEQLDLRASHRFLLGARRSLQVSLDLLNATDRANPEEYVYSSDWQRRGLLTGLPICPLLGLELTL